MASNALPTSRDRLFSLCSVMCDGLHTHETSIGVKHNTEALLRAAHAAALASDLAFGDALTARKEAYATLASASETSRVFLTNARKRLSKFFGEDYNTEWGAAGWPPATTGIPRAHDARLAQVATLKTFFTNHPTLESVDMEATAAVADTVLTTFNVARALVATKMAAASEAKNARDMAETNLRRRMNGLVSELSMLLSDEDARWLNLGLNRPADEETPEAPTLTTVTPGTPGTLVVTWNSTPRADHYRVWMLVEGTDTEFNAVDSLSDTSANLNGLTSGTSVKVHVTAVNSAGESQPGPDSTALVP